MHWTAGCPLGGTSNVSGPPSVMSIVGREHMNGDSHIQTVVTTEQEAEVMSRLNLLGGVITSISRAGDSQTAVGATIPTERISIFKAWLHSFTGGRSSVTEDLT